MVIISDSIAFYAALWPRHSSDSVVGIWEPLGFDFAFADDMVVLPSLRQNEMETLIQFQAMVINC